MGLQRSTMWSTRRRGPESRRWGCGGQRRRLVAEVDDMRRRTGGAMSSRGGDRKRWRAAEEPIDIWEEETITRSTAEVKPRHQETRRSITGAGPHRRRQRRGGSLSLPTEERSPTIGAYVRTTPRETAGAAVLHRRSMPSLIAFAFNLTGLGFPSREDSGEAVLLSAAWFVVLVSSLPTILILGLHEIHGWFPVWLKYVHGISFRTENEPFKKGEPSTLLDLDMDKLLEDSVPCRLRAKRGCATHPRSIAERVRRTRISDIIRKLQELVPNMDKMFHYLLITNLIDLITINGLQIQDAM